MMQKYSLYIILFGVQISYSYRIFFSFL